MSNQLQGIRKAQVRTLLPEIHLLPQVEYNGRKIDAAKFGPDTYDNNLLSMGKRYYHSDALPDVTFRPLSTAESLAVASYNFVNLAKPQIFDNHWFQAGRVLRTQDGVWVNLPSNREGKLITDESMLKIYLKKAQKIKVGNRHIYLGDNDLGFAEYYTFAKGVQDIDKFVRGGLAKVLEHTPKKVAKNLKIIVNKENYPRGIDVIDFEPVKRPTSRVVSLDSDWGDDGGRLDVNVDDHFSFNGGYAFGGLVSGEASTQKN